MRRYLAAASLLFLAACSHPSQQVAPQAAVQKRGTVPSFPSIPRPDSYESYRWAVETDNLMAFQSLVSKGLGPNLVMPDTNPALIYAMVSGSGQVVQWLLQHPKLDVDQTNARGDTALMTASGLGELAWVEALIKRGGQINPVSGWTPLHYAAANNRISVVELLLKRSAWVDAPSANGTTPLMMAARSNASEVANLLLKKGAQRDLVNEAGFSARDYAKRNGNDEMEKLLAAPSPNCGRRC